VKASKTSQWQQFAKVVESLNAQANLDTAYKVLFMGRHGEGYHNAAESYYGTPAWNVRQPYHLRMHYHFSNKSCSATGPNSTAMEQPSGQTQT